MGVEFMKEEDIKAILAPEVDMLVPRMNLGPKLCPGCGGSLAMQAGTSSITRLVCMACGLALDPETGFISRLGNAAHTVEPEFRMIVKPTPDGGA